MSPTKHGIKRKTYTEVFCRRRYHKIISPWKKSSKSSSFSHALICHNSHFKHLKTSFSIIWPLTFRFQSKWLVFLQSRVFSDPTPQHGFVDNDLSVCVNSDLKTLKSFWMEKCVALLCYFCAVGQYWLCSSVLASTERQKWASQPGRTGKLTSCSMWHCGSLPKSNIKLITCC